MKRLLFSFLFFSISLLLFSQKDQFQPEWAFGVNAGPTFSSVRFNPRISQENLTQYSVGVTVRYISEKSIGIQAELNYSLRGWRDLTDDVYINEYHHTLSYLELPLLTHLYFEFGKRVRFVFNVGPQVSYNLGEKWELELKNQEPQTYYDLPLQRKFEYGIKACTGFEFRTGIGSFILDGRYYFGLSDIFNNTKADYFAASANQVIGVNLTCLIRK